MTFLEYLLKHQHDDSPEGDLCKDALNERAFRKWEAPYNPATLRRRLIANGACSGALDALKKVVRRWIKAGGKIKGGTKSAHIIREPHLRRIK